MNKNLWPLNPNSSLVDPHIDWDAVNPRTIARTTPELARQISRNDCLTLLNKSIRNSMPMACMDIVNALVNNQKIVRPKTPKPEYSSVKERITEDMILETMEEALEKAQEAEDPAMVFKFAEALAKYKSMYNQPQERGDVIIQVVTGVPNGEYEGN